jgi:hypothetical protein
MSFDPFVVGDQSFWSFQGFFGESINYHILLFVYVIKTDVFKQIFLKP